MVKRFKGLSEMFKDKAIYSRRGWIVKIAIFLIVFYQKVISPFLPGVCRFYPSCSEYAREAVEKYGFKKGCYMAIKRLLRCHPVNAGGYDPVR